MSQPAPPNPPQPPSSATRRQRILASRALPRGYHVLGSEETIIGRGKECQVVLLADEISRRHARVVWEGGAHLVNDLGSSNGTFVNGDPVQKPRKLDHDDLVTLGPFRLRYLVVEGSREDLIARFDPRTADTTRRDVVKNPSQVQLAGSFTGQVLLEACQLLEVNKRSGDLKVAAGGLHGRVRFREGKIVDARVGIEVGEKAARRILGFRKGEYSFEATPDGGTPPVGPLALRPSALAMDILRMTDEAIDKTKRLDQGFSDRA